MARPPYTYATWSATRPRQRCPRVKLRDDGSYATTVSPVDGSLRVHADPNAHCLEGAAGRLLTDTHYNCLGQTVKTTTTYYDPTPPPAPRLRARPMTRSSRRRPSRSTTAWAGRSKPHRRIRDQPVLDLHRVSGHGPDGCHPAGGWYRDLKFARRCRAHRDSTWTYNTATPTDHAADATVTAYTYTPSGQQKTIADSAGNTWTFGYNLLGQQTTTADPGAGNSSTVYSPGGQLLIHHRRERHHAVVHYDAIGPEKGRIQHHRQRSESATDQLAAWTYDSLAKGQPTSAPPTPTRRPVPTTRRTPTPRPSRVHPDVSVHRRGGHRPVVPGCSGQDLQGHDGLHDRDVAAVGPPVRSRRRPAPGDLQLRLQPRR